MRKRRLPKRRIQGKQLAFVEELFSEETETLEQIMEKNYITKDELKYWLKDSRFRREIQIRIRWAYQQSEIMLARCSLIAAARLVRLTESENQETARRACLDIINLIKSKRQQKSIVKHIRGGPDKKLEERGIKPDILMTAKKQSKLLEVLAVDDEE